MKKLAVALIAFMAVVLSVNDVGQAQFNLEFDNQGKK